MKFLVDAHLPLHLAYRLQDAGYDTIHTRDLPLENRTPDGAINQISVDEKRIVIAKDADFVNSFMIARRPYKLLLVHCQTIFAIFMLLCYHWIPIYLLVQIQLTLMEWSIQCVSKNIK